MSTILLPNNFIQGTEGDDLLIGTSESDIILGEGGNDVLRGKQGDDELNGGNGNDVLNGGRGNDFITGGRGNDFLRGGQGQDQLFGGDFNESLFPSTSPFPPEETPSSRQIDILSGGEDADTFILSTFGPADQPLQPYLGGGFAIVRDFDSSEGDQIVLLGFANDYSFTNNSGDTEIFLGEDLIAVVANASVDPATDVNFVSQFAI